jgi:hypothetical protein
VRKSLHYPKVVPRVILTHPRFDFHYIGLVISPTGNRREEPAFEGRSVSIVDQSTPVTGLATRLSQQYEVIDPGAGIEAPQ